MHSRKNSGSNFVDMIRFAILAPSGHNTQPWIFSIDENRITIYPDYQRRLSVVDADDHALFISLGCALENLIIAANQFGYRAHVSYDLEPDKSEKITLELEKNSESRENGLFEAIPRRQVTRQQYDSRTIPEQELKALETAAVQKGIIFKLFTMSSKIKPLIEFVKEGNRLQFNNKQFVDELISWIRFNKKSAERTRDGLYSATMGAPSIPTWMGKLVMKLTSAENEAKKCEKAIKSSPALMMFIAETDDKRRWIDLGKSFQRVALTATQRNIKHAHLNMPCEEKSVRKNLQQHLGLNFEHPLLLLRIGYAEDMPDSLRRPVKDVLTERR